MNCTRCQGTGFLNAAQLPDHVATGGTEAILAWIDDEEEDHDVQVCDCCGNGEEWHGEPGRHYGPSDPQGQFGPYVYNGGLCECH